MTNKKYIRFIFSIPIILIGFIIVALIKYSSINEESRINNKPLTGLNIKSNYSGKMSSLISLQLFSENENISVSASIDNWYNLRQKIDVIKINFPYFSSEHRYLLDLSDKIGNLKAEDLLPENTRKIISDVQYDRNFGNTVINLPVKNKDYTGSLEMLWINGLRKINYFTYELYLPFFTLNFPEDSALKNLKKIKISLTSTDKYELDEKNIEFSGFKAIGNQNFYWFDIDESKSFLRLKFINTDLKNKRENILIWITTIFAIGLGLIIEEIISLFKKIRLKS